MRGWMPSCARRSISSAARAIPASSDSTSVLLIGDERVDGTVVVGVGMDVEHARRASRGPPRSPRRRAGSLPSETFGTDSRRATGSTLGWPRRGALHVICAPAAAAPRRPPTLDRGAPARPRALPPLRRGRLPDRVAARRPGRGRTSCLHLRPGTGHRRRRRRCAVARACRAARCAAGSSSTRRPSTRRSTAPP